MFRIDSDGAVEVLPTPLADGDVSGYFQRGNPGTGTKATKVSADWLNAVQESLLSVIEDEGLAPSKTDHTLLLQAINSKTGAGKYKHTQSSANTSWTVTHNLGSVDHMVQVFNTSNEQIIPDTITRGANSDTITFSDAQDGTALLLVVA